MISHRQIAWLIVTALLAAILMSNGCDSENRDWEKASSKHTVDAYKEYLDRNPEGAHADSASGRLELITAWNQAESDDTPSAYRHFLNGHENKDYVRRAKERIEAVARTQAIQSVATKGYGVSEEAVEELVTRAGRSSESLSSNEKEIILDVQMERLKVPEVSAYSIKSMQPQPDPDGYELDSSTRAQGGVGGENGEKGLEFIGIALPGDGNLMGGIMVGVGETRIPRQWLLNNRLGIRASMTIRDASGHPLTFPRSRPSDLVVSTELPRDRVWYLTSGPSRSGVVLPVGEGSVYCFKGIVPEIVPDVTFVGDREDPFYFGLLEGRGLTYLIGRGTVEMASGDTIHLPAVGNESLADSESEQNPGED